MPTLILTTNSTAGLTIGLELTIDSEPAKQISEQTRRENPKSLVVFLV